MRSAVMILLLCSGAANAQVWTPIGEGTDGTMYVDVTSIRPQGQYIKAWTRFAFKEARTSVTYPAYTYQSHKGLSYFDCKSETVAQKQTLYYDDPSGLGKVVYSATLTDAQLNFDDPVPGTLGQALLRRVCFQRR